MIDSDKQEFYEIIGAMLQVHGRAANHAVLQVWWGALKPWTLTQIKSALDLFIRDGGSPIPASIVALLPDPLGHPGAEEAWNAAQKNEFVEGAYMSGEMLHAVCAASDSLERGDMIGARRCFLDVYQSQVKNARLRGSPPAFRYFAPLALRGDEKRQVEVAATQDAITRGWLTADQGRGQLNRLEHQSTRMEWMNSDTVKRLPGN